MQNIRTLVWSWITPPTALFPGTPQFKSNTLSRLLAWWFQECWKSLLTRLSGKLWTTYLSWVISPCLPLFLSPCALPFPCLLAFLHHAPQTSDATVYFILEMPLLKHATQLPSSLSPAFLPSLVFYKFSVHSEPWTTLQRWWLSLSCLSIFYSKCISIIHFYLNSSRHTDFTIDNYAWKYLTMFF